MANSTQPKIISQHLLPSPRAFRAVWTQNFYAQQQHTAPTGLFTTIVDQWYLETALRRDAARKPSTADGTTILTDREMALLLTTEQRSISRRRQEQAGISDQMMAYRDDEIEAFLQPLHDPHAWPEYYPIGDPVVAPGSDEEDEEEDEEDQWQDVTDGPWIKTEYISHAVEAPLQWIFRKGRILIRVPGVNIQGRFDVIGSRRWTHGEVYCLNYCGGGSRMLLVLTQTKPGVSHGDIGSLEAWATELYKTAHDRGKNREAREKQKDEKDLTARTKDDVRV
ncbi:hypothetical protein BDY19DRAFT_904414 [Irpex rosettiformis]|uniref:Uncharacterized protein n=1 Tax=Irpex rosettiformis TaxID=378272 RepID=A0ACB8UC56_9APHY|nr:hypothetical protein BDY19DRAFT_904414 [Irpex rosettiformis]